MLHVDSYTLIEDVDTDASDTPRYMRHDANDVDFDAGETLRCIRRDFDEEDPTDPDATSIYDLTLPRHRNIQRASTVRRHQIRCMRAEIAGLRDAIKAGWDVGFELAHEEQRLAELEGRGVQRSQSAGHGHPAPFGGIYPTAHHNIEIPQ